MPGDLGNLRQISHPYHSSLIWRENKQLQDCRANDASSGVHAFDESLLEWREPLSRLFWTSEAEGERLSAKGLREKSMSLHTQTQEQEIDNWTLWAGQSWCRLSMFSRHWVRHYAVDRVLQTRMGEKMARFWALTWVFCVSITNVCGV